MDEVRSDQPVTVNLRPGHVTVITINDPNGRDAFTLTIDAVASAEDDIRAVLRETTSGIERELVSAA